jgi:hypothetical protein
MDILVEPAFQMMQQQFAPLPTTWAGPGKPKKIEIYHDVNTHHFSFLTLGRRFLLVRITLTPDLR